MSQVYESKPNIVKITVADSTGAQERHVVGYTVDEVVESLTLGLDGAEQRVAKPVTRKTHKRRTKAEIAAAKDLEIENMNKGRDSVPAGDKTWP